MVELDRRAAKRFRTVPITGKAFTANQIEFEIFKEIRMSELRGWIIYSWIALPTVMYGGYALLRLITQANAATPFRLTWFRAGHAHAWGASIDVAAVLHIHG
jgi:hypothetical protein